MLTTVAVSPSVTQAQPTPQPAAPAAARARLSVRDLPQILTKLQSQSRDEVWEGIDQLTILDRPECVPPLTELIATGPADAVADRAVEALGRIAEPSAIPSLETLTTHRRVGLRRRAFEALAQIQDGRVRRLLESGLRDSDRSIRSASALALGARGTRESLPQLFDAFSKHVVEAALAIGKLGDTEALTRFDGFLGNTPLTIVLDGYGEFLRRSDIPLAAKRGIVERLGEVSGPTVRQFLLDYQATLPERPRAPADRELVELVRTTLARIPRTAPRTAAPAPGATP